MLLKDEFKIIFKNNNVWLFVDFQGDNETELAVCSRWKLIWIFHLLTNILSNSVENPNTHTHIYV